ncbi:MAG TPA: hypothetical protein VJZ74_01020 [Pseudolabrys sp.]|nr:hypothetical protein [Pseudolabrys sp.]
MAWLDVDASYKECHAAIITNFKPHYRIREQFESTAARASHAAQHIVVGECE